MNWKPIRNKRNVMARSSKYKNISLLSKDEYEDYDDFESNRYRHRKNKGKEKKHNDNDENF